MRSSKLLLNEITAQLTTIYSLEEARSIVFMLFEQFIGFSKTDVLIDKPITQNYDFEPLIERLLNSEPIQYLLGNCYFFGNKFIVSKHNTLIPRPETEELVSLAISKLSQFPQNNETLKVLDIGTGTGCIAISIAKSVSNSTVSAWDISTAALEIAQLNAQLNNVKVKFEQVDILDYYSEPTHNYDLILSNPPYVTEAEKQDMHKNVLEYEPNIALFVENDNPLLFYNKIGAVAQNLLKPTGILLFEINEQFGQETANCLLKLGYKNIEIIKDIHKKNRIVAAQK
jgi:release factor glutamine methyltransferase